ncbi:MAG TPA: LPS assembly lipoprotein LptE [Candidatus Angelobacter sp.]|nr:LPS assembly lipoprotein LptE [Candidatus Angelobacter sp.]
MRRRASTLVAIPLVFGVLLVLGGCGYQTSGKAVRLPDNIHTVYVPMFGNTTQTFRVEQVMTGAVVQELRSRTNFRVVSSDKEGTADATLKGLVNYTSSSPLTYDSVTGRISSSLISVGMKVSLVSKSGKVLWDNPNFRYVEQYQVSRDTASFFDESNPAFLRVAQEFAKSLVSNLLEAY